MGQTGSGKTTLVLGLVGAARRQRRGTLVLEPPATPDPRWIPLADGLWTEFPPWERAVLGSTDSEVVLDDASVFRRKGFDVGTLAATCRKLGHRLWLIGSGPTAIPPEARAACGTCWVFRILGNECQRMFLEWGVPELKHAVFLNDRHGLLLRSGCRTARSFHVVSPQRVVFGA